jgi:hypothetical protein
MKRASSALLVALCIGMFNTALADESALRSAAQEFPPISRVDTYIAYHRETALGQWSFARSASAVMRDTILSTEAYMLCHLNGIDTQPNIRFPSRVVDLVRTEVLYLDSLHVDSGM